MSGFALDPDEQERPRRSQRWLITAVLAAPFLAGAVYLAVSGQGNTSTPKSVLRSPTPAGCETDKGRGLTGLGATPLDWAAHHVATYDPPSGPQTRWNARPDLQRFRGHEGAVYNQTRFYLNCVLTSYYIQLARPVPPRVALQRARRELPADARVVSFRSRPRCLQYGLDSDQLRAALAARDNFPPTTRVLVELPRLPGAHLSQRVGLSIVLERELAHSACSLSE